MEGRRGQEGEREGGSGEKREGGGGGGGGDKGHITEYSNSQQLTSQ